MTPMIYHSNCCVCGEEIEQPRVGRPKKYCSECARILNNERTMKCYWRRKAKEDSLKPKIKCVKCGAVIEQKKHANRLQKYCPSCAKRERQKSWRESKRRLKDVKYPPRTDCFGYDDGICTALDKMFCTVGECNFYKPT